MKKQLRTGLLAVGAAATAVLTAFCGGGTGTSGGQTTIDETGVERGIELASSVIAICHNGAGLRSSTINPTVPGGAAWVAKLLVKHRNSLLRGNPDRKYLLPPSQPGDAFGDCGGRITFPTYNHSNGTTSGTVRFEDYCSFNDDTGERDIADGDVSFVDNGTPSAEGPITTLFEANSPGGLTTTSQNSTGTTTLSQGRITFEDFLYDPGVPGGDPTSSNPDQITLGDARATDLDTDKSYRQSNYNVTFYNTAQGGTVATMSGRSYRSNGDYFDWSSSSAITMDASGNFTGGALTFNGANGTNAIVTLVPGSTFQATMTVNGTPVTNVPACQ